MGENDGSQLCSYASWSTRISSPKRIFPLHMGVGIPGSCLKNGKHDANTPSYGPQTSRERPLSCVDRRGRKPCSRGSLLAVVT